MALNDEEYWKQGSDRLEEYLAMVNSIIESFPEPRRTQVRKMMDSPIGTQFMTAPASTRRAFHNAFPCGLVDHSLRVSRNAVKIAEALWPGRWPTAQILFCALFHDLGKAGGPGKPYYIQTKDEWKSKKGEHFEVSKDEFIPNAERSIYTLLDNGIKLEYDEFQAIRLNDGAGSEANAEYSFKEQPLSLVIHWADHAAMKMEKEVDKI